MLGRQSDTNISAAYSPFCFNFLEDNFFLIKNFDSSRQSQCLKGLHFTCTDVYNNRTLNTVEVKNLNLHTVLNSLLAQHQWWWCCWQLFSPMQRLRRKIWRIIPCLHFFFYCFTYLFIWVEIRSCKLIQLLWPGSVHSSSACWDNCG